MVDRIDSIYAFISSDETGEGVVAMWTQDMGWLPMIAADEARLENLKPVARVIADTQKRKVKLIKLTTRVEVEEYDGETNPA
jgi:hypothetical protein